MPPTTRASHVNWKSLCGVALIGVAIWYIPAPRSLSE